MAEPTIYSDRADARVRLTQTNLPATAKEQRDKLAALLSLLDAPVVTLAKVVTHAEDLL